MAKLEKILTCKTVLIPFNKTQKHETWVSAIYF